MFTHEMVAFNFDNLLGVGQCDIASPQLPMPVGVTYTSEHKICGGGKDCYKASDVWSRIHM